MRPILEVASVGHKPKLLDQRVKASLTRKEYRPADALCVCAPLSKRPRILHWLLGQSSKRFSEHVIGGSLARSHRGPWQLIYYEAYLNQADAVGRERYLETARDGDF